MFKLLKRKSVSEGKSGENHAQICTKSLIEAIQNVRAGKAVYLNEEDIGCKNVALEWNEMIDCLCGQKRETILDVNHLLSEVTRMDFIKHMLDKVRKQSEAMHSIASGSEEMAASVDDVSNRAQSAASNANNAATVANHGTETINKAFSFVEDAFVAMDAINRQMNEMLENTKKIGDIVDIIKGIADQTNLLALNAAIEAARAGEQGRGFAVVADEVRKLAEHTKASVAEIQGSISNLQSGTQRSVEDIESIAHRLNSGKNLVDNALEAIKKMNNAINSINGEMLQIAANNEEQTATSQEIAAEVNNVSLQADSLFRECDKTGKAIFSLSQTINTVRINLLKTDFCLNTQELLDICIADHLLWRWQVYNMLLGYQKIDSSTVGTHRDCRLGKWYFSKGMEEFKNNPVFINMDKPHADLHRFAKEAVVFYEKKDMKAAEDALAQMDICSKQVVDALEVLKNHLAINKQA